MPIEIPTPKNFTITVYVQPIGAGFIEPSPLRYGFTASAGIKVIITAFPTPGWQFDHWSGGVLGTDNPITITMDSDKTVIAHFKRMF